MKKASKAQVNRIISNASEGFEKTEAALNRLLAWAYREGRKDGSRDVQTAREARSAGYQAGYTNAKNSSPCRCGRGTRKYCQFCDDITK